MYKVYWTEVYWTDETGPNDQLNSQTFDSLDMSGALTLMEELRLRRKAGQLLSFIGMVSENPNSVGDPGVSDKLPAGYDWKKRRL